MAKKLISLSMPHLLGSRGCRACKQSSSFILLPCCDRVCRGCATAWRFDNTKFQCGLCSQPVEDIKYNEKFLSTWERKITVADSSSSANRFTPVNPTPSSPVDPSTITSSTPSIEPGQVKNFQVPTPDLESLPCQLTQPEPSLPPVECVDQPHSNQHVNFDNSTVLFQPNNGTGYFTSKIGLSSDENLAPYIEMSSRESSMYDPRCEPWLPSHMIGLPRVQSTNSEGSVMSQPPLPYHLSSSGHSAGSAFPPHMNSSNQVWKGSNATAQAQVTFTRSPLNPITAQSNIQQGFQSSQNPVPVSADGYTGNDSQTSTSQDYPLHLQQQYGHVNQNPQMGPYSNNAYYMTNQVPGNPQYSQMEDVGPNAFRMQSNNSHYQRSYGMQAANLNNSQVPHFRQENQFQRPYNAPSGNPTAGFGQRQPYTTSQYDNRPGPVSLLSSSGPAGHVGYFSKPHSLAQAFDYNQKSYQYSSSTKDFNDGIHSHHQPFPSHNLPPQETFSQPARVTGRIESSKTQFNAIPTISESSSALLDILARAEARHAAGLLSQIEARSVDSETTVISSGEHTHSVAKTPPHTQAADETCLAGSLTALKLGDKSPNPVLRSRRNQSVARTTSTVKIDPILGPPPTFWPEGKPPNVVSNETPSTNTQLLPTSHSDAVAIIDGLNESDPFTVPSIATGGLSTVLPVTTQPKSDIMTYTNPFDPVRPPVGPLGPPGLNDLNETGCSNHLAFISPNDTKPSIQVAFDAKNMPFCEPARLYCNRATTGVVRISNIPYSVTRQEVIAFLGRNARLISEADEPIHIIMERVTSKTMDAYVEFVSIDEAVITVNRYENNRMGGRGGRLGQRHVEMEVVGHERLMKDLFPKAKNVIWTAATPEIIPRDPHDIYNSGFRSFVSSEELVMLVKHVETPHRSPFSRECPQRPYECLISTLVKFPWNMVDYIRLEECNRLHRAALDLTKLLKERLDNGLEHISVNERLLKRVQRAVFRCHGFTQAQKDDIAFVCGMESREAGLLAFADHWHVFKVLGPRQDIVQDVIGYYIQLLNESTTSVALVSLGEQSAKRTSAYRTIFGDFRVEYPADVNQMTLAAVALVEWAAVEKHLRLVLES